MNCWNPKSFDMVISSQDQFILVRFNDYPLWSTLK
nr:MAG TPA: hypothetical protein [Crassvirales sp.]DAM49373.1 MAG TPA: hypothetical protein [Crassvirales sp.]